jgi:hypothetical protein
MIIDEFLKKVTKIGIPVAKAKPAVPYEGDIHILVIFVHPYLNQYVIRNQRAKPG